MELEQTNSNMHGTKKQHRANLKIKTYLITVVIVPELETHTGRTEMK